MKPNTPVARFSPSASPTVPAPARILIADDHQIVSEGLRLLLRDRPEFEVVGRAFDADAAWEAIHDLKPDLVTVDLEMPRGGGLALARRLQQELPEIKVVVVTAHAEPRFIHDALRAGVHGYVLKANTGTQLVAAIRSALAGQVYLCPEVTTQVVQECRRRISRNSASPALSARELEVLKRMADGQTTKEIAFALGVSAKTIDSHRLRIFVKLGINSVAELIKFAVREGLTTL
jgi:DNA-binding NarL/FixJ family response regulator